MLFDLARAAGHATSAANAAYMHCFHFDSGKIPDGGICPIHTQDPLIIFDFTITDETNATNMSSPNFYVNLYSAQINSKMKDKKHGEAVRSIGYTRFVPVAMERHGALDIQGRELVDGLIREINTKNNFQASNWAASNPKSYWYQRFSLTVYITHALRMSKPKFKTKRVFLQTSNA